MDAPQHVPTEQLVAAMLQQRDGVSDVIFSPGRPPQVEAKGELIQLPFRGLEILTPEQTQQIATEASRTYFMRRHRREAAPGTGHRP